MAVSSSSQLPWCTTILQSWVFREPDIGLGYDRGFPATASHLDVNVYRARTHRFSKTKLSAWEFVTDAL